MGAIGRTEAFDGILSIATAYGDGFLHRELKTVDTSVNSRNERLWNAATMDAVRSWS
jgi:hypothetical protein